MDASRAPAGRPASATSAGRSQAASLASRLLGDLDRLTDQLVAAIWRSDRTYVDGAVERAEVWTSCHANIERVVQVLAGALPDAAEAYDAPRATGRRRAEQGVPLEAVLHSYRIGGRLIWQALVALDRAEDGDPEVLLDAATSVWEVVDSFSTEVALAYRREEAERVRRDTQETQALVVRLVRGIASEPAVAEEARSRLGLPIEGRYTVVAIPSDSETWARAALSAHRLASVWSTYDGHGVGLVPLRGRPLDAVATALAKDAAGPAGLGQCAGLSAVDSAWAEARLALSTLPRDHRGAVSLDERIPEAMLIRSPELTERLLQGTLGPLLELPDAEVLLSTLCQWLAADRSPSRTAERLYCHRNTVLNRLHRISTVTGVAIDDPSHHLSLVLAVRALSLRS